MQRRTRNLMFWLGLALIGLTGCGGSSSSGSSPTSSGTPGFDVNPSLTSGGVSRSYILHIPANFDANALYPLVIVYHGGGGTPQKIIAVTGFSTIADNEGFLVAYPAGIDNHWNDGRGVTQPELNGVDDIQFTKDLIADIENQYKVDTKRIYATGASNGGQFVHRIACEIPGSFTAIGVVVGSIPSNLYPGTTWPTNETLPPCAPSQPISIVSIRGDADPAININGGEVGPFDPITGNTISDGGYVESNSNVETFWSNQNGCTGKTSSEITPTPPLDSTRVFKDSFTGCNAGVSMDFYVVSGMGHVWPPTISESTVIFGNTSLNIDASQVIWDFFKGTTR
jgi:polyhydroxybutyrate depolymerase